MTADKYGRTVHVGDWLVFPGRKGSQCWISVAMVTGIDRGQGKVFALSVSETGVTNRVRLRALDGMLNLGYEPGCIPASMIEAVYAKLEEEQA